MEVNCTMWFIIYVIFLTCFPLYIHLSIAADTISANQTLSGDQTLTSAGGGFVLGFFRPGNSSNFYIGIWYSTYKVPQQTVVWVANRDKPVVDRYSSELRISNGNLAIFNEIGIEIWSTNLRPSTSTSIEAVLLEQGNLVLRDGSNSSEPLWESFDHPTNTFLPGSKLGFNKLTGESTGLTSWKNDQDPAPGLYSYEIDPNGTDQYYIIWNRSKIMWTTGTWIGQMFSLIPEMTARYLYNYVYVSNDHEKYFIYSPTDNSFTFHYWIDVGGQFQLRLLLEPSKQWLLVWDRSNMQCKVYAFCGAFASCVETSPASCSCLKGFHPKSVDEWNSKLYSGGCTRNTKLQCQNSNHTKLKGDGFLSVHSRGWPGDLSKVAVQNEQQCRSTCLNNCSCTAYVYLDFTFDCLIWFGDVLNLRKVADDDVNQRTLYVRLAASEFNSSNAKKRKVIGIVVGSGSAVILFFLFMVRFVILRRPRTGKRDKIEESMAQIANAAISSEGGQNNGHLVTFSFKSILAATGNFSEANKLGEGGFGPVYKGKFPGHQEVAIKRLSKQSGQGLEEFMNELKLIANLQHKYLVRLLGCCGEGEEKILVYEYMANRSLDKLLYDPSEREKLVWDKRLKIAEGVAQGLLYIHKFSRLKVIHRDLKASNILLDEDMNPKISDFGMARIFGINQTEANTNRVMGTYGYMSPEYAFSGKFSEKSDVFSFGVLLLEIVSGRRNTSFHRSGLSFTLLSWAWELWKEGKEAELIDASMKDKDGRCTKEAVKCIHVGLLCVQEDPIDRPTMSLVVFMLSNDSQNLPSPKEPAFLIRKGPAHSGFQKTDERSNNELTISLPDGR